MPKRACEYSAELAGAGWSFDAYNETAPFADIQAVAMRNAIQDAGISPDEVDYINAHAQHSA
jgi:3-oxoacyl-(acyl-carrier-protein) synthase